MCKSSASILQGVSRRWRRKGEGLEEGRYHIGYEGVGQWGIFCLTKVHAVAFENMSFHLNGVNDRLECGIGILGISCGVNGDFNHANPTRCGGTGGRDSSEHLLGCQGVEEHLFNFRWWFRWICHLKRTNLVLLILLSVLFSLFNDFTAGSAGLSEGFFYPFEAIGYGYWCV